MREQNFEPNNVNLNTRSYSNLFGQIPLQGNSSGLINDGSSSKKWPGIDIFLYSTLILTHSKIFCRKCPSPQIM